MEQRNSDGLNSVVEQWNSVGGIVGWNSGTVLVE